MTEEKKDFNLPKKYIFIILIFGIIFISVSFIFFKGENLNNYKLENQNTDESLSEKMLKENSEAINSVNSFGKKEFQTINENDHVLGDVNAKIKIVYYNDLDAPFNEDFFETINKLRDEFKDISIAYRHFPMRSNANSMKGALATECASDQDKFWEMAERIIDEKYKSQVNNELYLSLAEEFEMNVDDFEKCLEEEKYLEKVQEQLEEAEEFGVMGAPTIFVNNIILAGAYPIEDFVDSSDRERKGLRSIIEGEMLK